MNSIELTRTALEIMNSPHSFHLTEYLTSTVRQHLSKGEILHLNLDINENEEVLSFFQQIRNQEQQKQRRYRLCLSQKSGHNEWKNDNQEITEVDINHDKKRHKK
jgi:hypothetical protein